MEAVGRNLGRAVHIASERQSFHVMLPTQSTGGSSPSLTAPVTIPSHTPSYHDLSRPLTHPLTLNLTDLDGSSEQTGTGEGLHRGRPGANGPHWRRLRAHRPFAAGEGYEEKVTLEKVTRSPTMCHRNRPRWHCLTIIQLEQATMLVAQATIPPRR